MIEHSNEHIAALGHELKVGDYVEFCSLGHTIIAQIKDFVYDKAVCYPIGWRGEAEFKEKIRKQYKVICKNCWLVKVKFKETTQN